MISNLFRVQIAELQAQYDHSVAEKEELTRNIAQTAARLKRASKLTTALSDEQVRWTENIAVRMTSCRTIFPHAIYLTPVPKQYDKSHAFLTLVYCE